MKPNIIRFRLPRSAAAFLAVLFVLASAILPAAPLHAQGGAAVQPGADALVEADAAGGVQITWRSPGATRDAVQAALPTVRYQGYDLPMQSIPVRLAGPDALAGLQVRRLDAVDLPPGTVAPGAPDAPPVLNEDGALKLAPPAEPALPTAPVFVLRSGSVNGEFIAVLGVSPIYAENGMLRLATALDAYLPGATRITEDATEFMAAGRLRAEQGAGAAGVAAALGDATSALAAASAAKFKIEVAAPGIQRVPLAALPGLAAADLANARLTLRGQPVPVQVVGSELRFYAPTVGDRWNTTSTYLLGVDAANRSPAMQARPVAPLAAASAPSVVLERGSWAYNTTYASLSAGVDGDHWFAADLTSDPGAFEMSSRNSVTATLWNDDALALPSSLPLAAGTSTFTVRLSPYRTAVTDVQPFFSFRVGTDTGVTLDFANVDVSYKEGDRTRWYANYDHRFTTTATPHVLTFSLLPVGDAAAAAVNSIVFERPVTLDFGQQGAYFSGSAGQVRYAWKNAAPAGGFYDVTDAALPVVLTGANANGFTDTQAERSYLLAGENTLHSPAVEAFTAVSFAGKGAQAIYIVPDDSYTGLLAPLVALRQQQGYKVEVVDVRQVYDAFSFGQVAPEGIRRFLQYAYTNWSPLPISAVLVGDGTWDVKNYTRKAMTPALIPPYMHDGIDPWIGEAPCDNCYGQLNDRPGVYDEPAIDAPHTGDDPNGRIFDTELWIGRLPVKSPGELDVLVSKIVGYETAVGAAAAAPDAEPVHEVLFYADNHRKPKPNVAGCQTADGYTPDTAGNFANLSDGLVSEVGSAARTQRIYYDPFRDMPPSEENQYPSTLNELWREPNTNRLGERLFAAMNGGPDVAVYNGHASTWHMGATERDSACEEPDTGGQRYRPAVLNLYEETRLNNAVQLFVQLSMTCLTSQFAIPADAGTTIDERLLLHPGGGAVAVWGPAGLSVVHGHDLLQRGFFEALFAAPDQTPRLGELLDAGYETVRRNGYGTEDVLRTFLLLGDPLTRLHFNSTNSTFLPVVGK